MGICPCQLWGYFFELRPSQVILPTKKLASFLHLHCSHGMVTGICPSVRSQQLSEELFWAPWSEMLIDVTLLCLYPLLTVICRPACPLVGLLHVAELGDFSFSQPKECCLSTTILLVFNYVRSLPGRFTNQCLQYLLKRRYLWSAEWEQGGVDQVMLTPFSV